MILDVRAETNMYVGHTYHKAASMLIVSEKRLRDFSSGKETAFLHHNPAMECFHVERREVLPENVERMTSKKRRYEDRRKCFLCNKLEHIACHYG